MVIKKQIKNKFFKNKKNIRLDIFLNECLFKKNGYYYNKKAIGKHGDFITAPEISQMFGEIIGLYLFYIWKVKINTKFNFIELGPGNGTLFKDIAKSVSRYPQFLKKAKITFIEINHELINIQKKNIKNLECGNINWRKSIDFKSKIPSIIYSNEFFDCFPVRQFIFKKVWFEKYVSFNNQYNYFFMNERLVKNRELLSFLNLHKKKKILEISFERNKYFEKICKYIKNNGGIFLTVDYGYLKNIRNFTLQSIQNHKFSNVLENIGAQDITSHVNFNDFLIIAQKHKLKIEEFSTQREFLIKYGILQRGIKLSNSKNKKKIGLELDRLINKKEMGSLFKFLVITNL